MDYRVCCSPNNFYVIEEKALGKEMLSRCLNQAAVDYLLKGCTTVGFVSNLQAYTYSFM
jgi:hypothetical protein